MKRLFNVYKDGEGSQDIDNNMLDKFEQTEEEFVVNQRTGGGNDDPPAGGDNDDFKPSSHWETVRELMPEEQRESFEIPEDVNAENEIELLREAFKGVVSDGPSKQQNPNGVYHPLALDLQQQAIEKGKDFDPVKWFEEKKTYFDSEALQSRPDDELVIESLVKQYGLKSEENPNGLEMSEYEAHVAKMSPLEKKIEAGKVREQLQTEASRYKFDPENFKAPEPPKPEDIKRSFEDAFGKTKDELTIGGIDISKAIDDKSKEAMQNMFIPEADGYSKMQKMLADDKVLLKLAFLESAGDDFFKNIMSEESTKLKMLEFMEKLDDDRPDFSGKGKGPKSAPNLNALEEPEY